jgi:RNA polymerase sigma factor (sigma-70 family)
MDLSEGVDTVSAPMWEKSDTTPGWSDDGRSRADLEQFVRTRRRLFAIACRIVGNAHEAEDVVQEVWLRWQRIDRTVVINAEAFLVTATARQAMNVVQSARHRRETSVATCPHEDAEAAHVADPQAQVERGERIGHVAQLLLERLPPAERAAYVLREGFEYPYRQIAETLHIGAAYARQLVKRARAHVAAGRRRSINPVAHSRLRQAFTAASCIGDLAGLEALLDADVNAPAKLGGGARSRQTVAPTVT